MTWLVFLASPKVIHEDLMKVLIPEALTKVLIPEDLTKVLIPEDLTKVLMTLAWTLQLTGFPVGLGSISGTFPL